MLSLEYQEKCVIYAGKFMYLDGDSIWLVERQKLGCSEFRNHPATRGRNSRPYHRFGFYSESRYRRKHQWYAEIKYCRKVDTSFVT
jgi:hypothetical protein